MTTREYLSALSKLGLMVSSQETAELLGMSPRHVWRLSVGDSPIPRPVEILLKLYLLHGLPEGDEFNAIFRD